jgi:hypothetical protein
MIFVEIHTEVLKLLSAIFHKYFGQHFKQDHHSLQMADHFTVHREHLFAHPSWNILHHCLAVPSHITFWP